MPEMAKEKVVEEVQALTDGLGCHAAIDVSEQETALDMACAVNEDAQNHGASSGAA